MGGGWPFSAVARPRAPALLHRHAAAERHRQPAHGPRPRQHDPGHADPLLAHARPGGALAARHRPRRHRDPDGGRAPARAGGAEPPADRAQGLRRSGLGLEGGVGRRHQPAVASPGRLRRLVARALHPGRGSLAGGPQGVRRSLSRRPDLQGPAPGQLGLPAADRGLGPRGRGDRGRGPPLVHPLSARRAEGPPHHGRDHAARDHARRHRGRRPSRRPPLPRPDRAPRDPAAGGPPPADRCRRLLRPREGLGRGEDHAWPRLQRLRGRPPPRPRDDQHSGR